METKKVSGMAGETTSAMHKAPVKKIIEKTNKIKIADIGEVNAHPHVISKVIPSTTLIVEVEKAKKEVEVVVGWSFGVIVHQEHSPVIAGGGIVSVQQEFNVVKKCIDKVRD